MKKLTIYFVLTLCLASMILLLGLYGIDIECARRDYVNAVKQGNYEQPITGCLFDFVCEKYTQELWK